MKRAASDDFLVTIFMVVGIYFTDSRLGADGISSLPGDLAGSWQDQRLPVALALLA
jgi:hypothetical protein